MDLIKKDKWLSIKKIEIIYIVLFSLAFLMKLGRQEVNYFFKYIISIIWICIAFFKLYKNKFKINEYKSEIIFYVKLFIFPYLAMSVYNVFLYASRRADILTIGRSISYISTMVITIIAIVSTSYLLKKRALICTVYAMFISFFIGVIYNIITNPYAMFKGLIDTFINNVDAINYFEIHDLTFAFGLIFLLYFLKNKFLNENEIDFKIMLGSFIIMFLGFKRIQLLAILLVSIYIFIINKIKNKFKNKVVDITAILLVIACILYVWGIETGILQNIITSLGINSMGRFSFYNWICGYTEFKISFLGVGLGASSKMMELYTNWQAGAIHSDILRIFAEIGLIGFVLWLVYYVIYSYKKIVKNFSFKIGYIYFIMTMYLFLLHFTDNTVNYFTTQYVYMIIIISISIKDKYYKNIN